MNPPVNPLVLALAAAAMQVPAAGECGACHADIARRFAATGMARSFYRLKPATEAGEFRKPFTFYHAPSERYYTGRAENGRYFLTRYQAGPANRKINLVEKEIHYVLGSGNHARGYVHRTTDGRLLQMPLTWYSARGGFWEMAPGYDRPDHPDFRREIDYQCFGCHNSLPEIEPGADRHGLPPRYPGRIPEGIGCAQCHGSGNGHAANPARSSASAQREICMRCHLETTSAPLPHALLRHDAGWLSYRPGTPLHKWLLHFDHAPSSPLQEKFEVVGSVYRLLKSACFRASQDRMTCTTCHDPHSPAAEQRYDKACTGCHKNLTNHPREGCPSCHMPKRATDDAPHVSMTDHLIQRQPAPAASLESQPYRGAVALYYPKTLKGDPEADLYLAAAQLRDKSNPREGIRMMEEALRRVKPRTGFFHFELAEAYRAVGRLSDAVPAYREALRHAHAFPAMWTGLAAAQELAEAIRTLETARSRFPHAPEVLNALGDSYYKAGRAAEAIAVLQRASELNPDLPEVWNNRCVALAAARRFGEAIQACEEALRLQPDLAAAQANLGLLLKALEKVRR